MHSNQHEESYEIPEQLQKLEQMAEHTFWGYLGCKIKKTGEKKVVLYLDVQPHHMNTLGIVHGGVLSSLIDNSMGVVAMMTKPQMKIVTTHLNLIFLAQATSEHLETTAIIVHETKKSFTIEAKVTDSNGVVCTMGTGTFRVLA